MMGAKVGRRKTGRATWTVEGRASEAVRSDETGRGDGTGRDKGDRRQIIKANCKVAVNDGFEGRAKAQRVTRDTE